MFSSSHRVARPAARHTIIAAHSRQSAFRRVIGCIIYPGVRFLTACASTFKAADFKKFDVLFALLTHQAAAAAAAAVVVVVVVAPSNA
jgi:hypothetical protein